MTNRIFKKIEYKKGKAALYWKNDNAAYSEEYFSKSDNPPGESFLSAMRAIARNIPGAFGLPDTSAILSRGYRGVPDPVLISVTWHHQEASSYVSFILEFPTKEAYDSMEIKTPPRLTGRTETNKKGDKMFYVLDPGIDAWLEMLIIAANRYLDSPAQAGLFEKVMEEGADRTPNIEPRTSNLEPTLSAMETVKTQLKLKGNFKDEKKEDEEADPYKMDALKRNAGKWKESQKQKEEKLDMAEILTDTVSSLPFAQGEEISIETPEYPGYVFTKQDDGFYECRVKEGTCEIKGYGLKIRVAYEDFLDQVKEKTGSYQLAGYPGVWFNKYPGDIRTIVALRQPDFDKDRANFGAGISHETAYKSLLYYEKEAGTKKKRKNEPEPDLDRILEGYDGDLPMMAEHFNTAAMTEIINPEKSAE